MMIRSRYSYGERSASLSFEGVVSLAKQSFAKEADINNLVAKYMRTGVYYDQPGLRRPAYGDFSDVGDYRSIVERVQAARADFAALPADVRLSYNNDVGEYLADLAEQASQAPDDVLEDSEVQDQVEDPEGSVRDSEGSGGDSGDDAAGS